jgi:hypothetical protein
MMFWAYSTHEKTKTYKNFNWKNLNEREYLEELGVDGKIILE